IDREDGDWYAFVTDAQDHLEQFYRRYGCDLIAQSDGYFYLLPTGDQLSRRHLTAGEMLVGQVLALQYLDPATVQSGGMVTREQLLTRLAGIVGDRELARAFDPRRKRFEDERIVHEIIRKRFAEAIRHLEAMGFIKLPDQDRVRLRAPVLRFADPVRGLQDQSLALERLIMTGQAVDLGADYDAVDTNDAGSDGLPDEDEDDSVEVDS
ncbi:MAG: chromosome partition protein MukE, partial [Dehalococcoidia bacterium]